MMLSIFNILCADKMWYTPTDKAKQIYLCAHGAAVAAVGALRSATASGELCNSFGIRTSHILGSA